MFLCGASDIAGVFRARGVAAWWVRDDRTVEMTAGARVRTTWLLAET